MPYNHSINCKSTSKMKTTITFVKITANTKKINLGTTKLGLLRARCIIKIKKIFLTTLIRFPGHIPVFHHEVCLPLSSPPHRNG